MATHRRLGFPVTLRLKQVLDLRHERGDELIASALFNRLASAVAHYRLHGKGLPWYLELNQTSAPYRPILEEVFASLLRVDNQYLQLEHVYEQVEPLLGRLLRDHLVDSRRRKLALLAA